MDSTEASSFELVRDQIGFCGIWCGSCAMGNGSLRELTRRCADTLAAYGLKHWAPEGLDHAQLSRGLETIQRVASCPGCLQDGGRDNCELRVCARERGLDDCLQCDARSGCPHGELLEHMRSGAAAADLLVRSDDQDRQGLLTKWAAELPTRWPSCLLFRDDGC